MKRLADAFTEIRARQVQLRGELDRALSGAAELDPRATPAPGHPEAFLAGQADAELLHALFADAEKAVAHSQALGNDDVELVRRNDGCWLVRGGGYAVGYAFTELAAALAVGRRLRALAQR